MANQLVSGHIINSSSADNMGASITSGVVDISRARGVGAEIKVDNTGTASTGTAAGTIALQVSNSMVNWVAVELSGGGTTITVTSGSDVNSAVSLTDLPFRFLRVVYTRSSGDGILDVYTFVDRA